MKTINRKKSKILGRFSVAKPIGYLLIFFVPVFTASIVALVWGCIHKFIPVVNTEDNIALWGFVALLGVAYSVLAARVLDTVWRQFEEIRYCIIKSNKEDFILKRDLRIPGIIHFILAALSMAILFIMMVMNYKSLLVGKLIISTWVFVVMLWLEIAIELDDPLSGIWSIDVDEEWLIIETETTEEKSS